ncbi:2-C-methyl-D-erythritol 4-phosphate cytidylyltransferase [candidate division KSB1 bacterium]|nr:2-C-methyl-D-erythritol 4-phosphate cytidylyltransferase [candidate division KSB1 bacterium]
MNVCAIIAAAGRGTRMNSPLNKQFLELGDKPIIAHTLEKFDHCPEIDCIDIIVPQEWLLYVAENIVDKFSISKVRKIVVGGATRQESVFAALKAIDENIRYVAIHDAVRPLLPPDLLLEVLHRGMETSAAILAVPVRDSLKKITNGKVEHTLDRSSIWQAQTPQVFERSLIVQAHEQAFRDQYFAADDSELVERLGHPVYVVESNFMNFKITTPEDLRIAKYFIEEVK